MRAKVNGTELYFDVVGSQLQPEGGAMVERPVCFVLHGGPVIDHSYFRPWMDPLAEVMQLIYVDYRGTGRSQRMSHDSYTRDNTINDLEALRQYLGLGKIAVFGHSHGGFLAQLYALAFPDQVSHLILAATSAYTGPEHEADSEANLDQLKIRKPELADIIQHRRENPPQNDAEAKARFHKYFGIWFNDYDPQVGHEIVERMIFSLEVLHWWNEHEAPNFDLRPHLGKIKAPTLILAGSYDWRTTVKQAEVMLAGIPGAQLELFENSAHQLYIEEQEKFIHVMSEFIKRYPHE